MTPATMFRRACAFLDAVWMVTRTLARPFGVAVIGYVITLLFVWRFAPDVFPLVAIASPLWFALGCQAWHFWTRARRRASVVALIVRCRLCGWAETVIDRSLMGPLMAHHDEYICPATECPGCGHRGPHTIHLADGEPVRIECGGDAACGTEWVPTQFGRTTE